MGLGTIRAKSSKITFWISRRKRRNIRERFRAWLFAMTTATLKSAVGAPAPLPESYLRRDADRKRVTVIAAGILDHVVFNLGGLPVRAGAIIPQ